MGLAFVLTFKKVLIMSTLSNTFCISTAHAKMLESLLIYYAIAVFATKVQ